MKPATGRNDRRGISARNRERTLSADARRMLGCLAINLEPQLLRIPAHDRRIAPKYRLLSIAWPLTLRDVFTAKRVLT